MPKYEFFSWSARYASTPISRCFSKSFFWFWCVTNESNASIYSYFSQGNSWHRLQYSGLLCCRLHLAILQDRFPSPPPHPGQCPSRCIGHNPQFNPHKENNKSDLVKSCKISLLPTLFSRFPILCSRNSLFYTIRTIQFFRVCFPQAWLHFLPPMHRRCFLQDLPLRAVFFTAFYLLRNAIIY